MSNNYYGYIYRTINTVNGNFYIGQHVPKEGESIKRYLGSGVRLKEEVQKYGRKFFTKEILAYAYSQEELNQLEKEWISAVIGQDDCLNNYINTERKEYVAFCPVCNKETFHYKGGLCRACFARKQYDNNNVAKYFKKDYQVKWCPKCQKETQHSGANYNNCASCYNTSGFNLYKNGNKVSLRSGTNIIIEDVSFIFDTQKEGDTFILPEGIYIEDETSTTPLQKIIKNQNVSNWMKIYFRGNKNPIRVTTDHPFVTDYSDFVKGKDLKIGDALLLDIGKRVMISDIQYLDMEDDSYDVETESGYFNFSTLQSRNCRTRVMSNINGREGNLARGNIAFVTIILPQLALEAKGNIDKFFKLLDKYIEMSKESLLDRYKYIISMPKECAPFIYKNDIMYSNGAKETIENYMKQGSLSIGYLGLHECLMALLGKHHGESEEAQELGLKIVGRIRELTDEYTKNYHLNFSTFATPAENLSNTALKRTRARYGVIKDVTDKEYFTNSNHVDVAYHTSYRHKIEVEAPYHQLANAGNITYIEMDSDISNNIDAFEKILATMKECGVGYCGINIPVDECPVCYYSGNIGDTCPVCGYNENKEYDKDFIKELDDKKITIDTKIREKLMEG